MLEGMAVQSLLAKGTEGAPGNPRIVSHASHQGSCMQQV